MAGRRCEGEITLGWRESRGPFLPRSLCLRGTKMAATSEEEEEVTSLFSAAVADSAVPSAAAPGLTKEGTNGD